MAKWCGKIGFITTSESATQPGVWEENAVERTYYGDFNRISRRLQSASTLNDNVVISNELSIVADPFANENFQSIRYAEYMNTKWKITNIEVRYPRLILSMGEMYNE